jgi:hypothetical protein
VKYEVRRICVMCEGDVKEMCDMRRRSNRRTRKCVCLSLRHVGEVFFVVVGGDLVDT